MTDDLHDKPTNTAKHPGCPPGNCRHWIQSAACVNEPVQAADLPPISRLDKDAAELFEQATDSRFENPENGGDEQATKPTRQITGDHVIGTPEGGFPKGPRPPALDNVRQQTTKLAGELPADTRRCPNHDGSAQHGCEHCRTAERARIRQIIEGEGSSRPLMRVCGFLPILLDAIDGGTTGA